MPWLIVRSRIGAGFDFRRFQQSISGGRVLGVRCVLQLFLLVVCLLLVVVIDCRLLSTIIGGHIFIVVVVVIDFRLLRRITGARVLGVGCEAHLFLQVFLVVVLVGLGVLKGDIGERVFVVFIVFVLRRVLQLVLQRLLVVIDSRLLRSTSFGGGGNNRS